MPTKNFADLSVTQRQIIISLAHQSGHLTRQTNGSFILSARDNGMPMTMPMTMPILPATIALLIDSGWIDGTSLTLTNAARATTIPTRP